MSLKRLGNNLTNDEKAKAELVVQNDLAAMLGVEKKTNEELAESMGISRSTLQRLIRRPEVIAYMNELSDQMLSKQRAVVYSQLMKLITAPQPSVKAIDLFMRRFGLLTERHEHSITNETPAYNTLSEDEVNERLKRMGEILEADEDNE